jgi:hypothetical protein
MSPLRIRRLDGNPIVRPEMDDRMGGNVQGPSLIRVPDWIPSPLGRYYLYFADHKGAYIRLAVADTLTGPWRMHRPGALTLAESGFPTEPIAVPAGATAATVAGTRPGARPAFPTRWPTRPRRTSPRPTSTWIRSSAGSLCTSTASSRTVAR